MKKFLSLLMVSLVAAAVSGQPRFDFGFEDYKAGAFSQWTLMGSPGYRFFADSLVKVSGRYSAVVESPAGGGGYGACGLVIPAGYAGRAITLTGYIRTERVDSGYAGLWMRIDPGVAFDNMSGRGLQGTTGWRRCEVTLPLSAAAEKIVVGGILVGGGRMWIDSLAVSIDGSDISQAVVLAPKRYPAAADTAFFRSSGLTAEMLGEIPVRDLRTVGYVWGFLKYHHPAFCEGLLDADAELFRLLHRLAAARRPSAAMDSLLSGWIDRLDELAARTSPEPYSDPKADTARREIGLPAPAVPMPGLDISPALASRLQRTAALARGPRSYYVDFYPAGNPMFTRERSYGDSPYPDAGVRLLALYRYWNMFRYFSPYRRLTDGDWDAALAEFVPRFVSAADGDEYARAALGLFARTGDGHAAAWSVYGSVERAVGLRWAVPEIGFVGRKAAVVGFCNDSLAKLEPLRRGDVIRRVDGRPVGKIVRERLGLAPGSNRPARLARVALTLLNSADSTVRITYRRGGRRGRAALRTYGPQEVSASFHFGSGSDTCLRRVAPNIVCLQAGSFSNDFLPQIWEAVKSTDGLIIDLRDYPSDFMVYTLTGLLSPGPYGFAKFTRATAARPGEFYFTDVVAAGRENPDFYRGVVAVLADEGTQSQGEYTVMALRGHPRAAVIGSATAGADGNVSEIRLPGGITTYISGIGVYYPDGGQTQRIGIRPDVKARPTLRSIRSGRDRVLEAAVGYIQKASKAR